MCKYCTQIGVKSFQIKGGKKYDAAYLIPSQKCILIEFDSTREHKPIVMPAKFCPMCGRKLC